MATRQMRKGACNADKAMGDAKKEAEVAKKKRKRKKISKLLGYNYNTENCTLIV